MTTGTVIGRSMLRVTPPWSFTCGVIDSGMGLGHPVAVNDRAGARRCEQKSEDRIMSHMKVATQRKRRTKAVPVLGAAGLSFSLATGAPAAVGGVNPDPATSALVAEQVMDEEQISDVSLVTFRMMEVKVAAHGGRAHGRPWSAKAPAGQTSITSESTSGQRASLSGVAAAASGTPPGVQIQALVTVDFAKLSELQRKDISCADAPP